MNIRVVRSKDKIFTLNSNERIIHLAFRPSNKDIFGLIEACPKIEVIQVPKSYMRTVSKYIEMFLEMQKIQLIEGDVWGHRKDINEYYRIPSSVTGKYQIAFAHPILNRLYNNGSVAKNLRIST
jgi:hypothetical protein